MNAEEPVAESSPKAIDQVPADITSRFLDRTLGEGAPHETYEKGQGWYLGEQKVTLPSGPARMRLSYHQEFSDHARTKPSFETLRLDFFEDAPDKNGAHQPIAEMWWRKNAPGESDDFPYDLRLAHRYLFPDYRSDGAKELKGMSGATYAIAETVARQMAAREGRAVTVAQSTDQPKTMRFIEGQGYRPYEAHEALRAEVLQYADDPTRFTYTAAMGQGWDGRGQKRNPALRRVGVPVEESEVRVWFWKSVAA